MNSVEKNIWKEEGRSVNRMEMLRNLSSLHNMAVSLPSAIESRITARENTGCIIDPKCKVQNKNSIWETKT